MTHSDRRSYTTWSVFVRTTDGWASPDPEPALLFSYTAPPMDGVAVNARLINELRAYADKLENRVEFFRLQQQLGEEGFET